jgi:hypothetical protein
VNTRRHLLISPSYLDSIREKPERRISSSGPPGSNAEDPTENMHEFRSDRGDCARAENRQSVKRKQQQ